MTKVEMYTVMIQIRRNVIWSVHESLVKAKNYILALEQNERDASTIIMGIGSEFAGPCWDIYKLKLINNNWEYTWKRY